MVYSFYLRSFSVQDSAFVLIILYVPTVANQAPLSMGILQAKILESVAMPSSRRTSQSRDWTQVDSLSSEPPRKPHIA